MEESTEICEIGPPIVPVCIEIKPICRVVYAIDPGWRNLGYCVVLTFQPSNARIVLSGTHDLNIEKYSKNTNSEYPIAISIFLEKLGLARYFEDCTVIFEAIVIEQQPRGNAVYTRHIELQTALETAIITNAIANPRRQRGTYPKIYRINANSYRKIFGIASKNTTYEERKRTLLAKINDLMKPENEKERAKYSLVYECDTDHEADALACYNVYMKKYQSGASEDDTKEKKRKKNVDNDKPARKRKAAPRKKIKLEETEE